MASHDIQPLGTHRCLLGESPLWHPTEQALYAVDIPGRQVLRWRDGAAWTTARAFSQGEGGTVW